MMVSLSGCLGDETPEAQASLVDTLLADDGEGGPEQGPEAAVEPAPQPAAEAVAGPAIEPETAAASDLPVVVRAPRASFTLAELFLPRAEASDPSSGNPLDALAAAPYRFGSGPGTAPADSSTPPGPPSDSAPAAAAAAPEVSLCPTDDEAIAAGVVYYSETGGGSWVYAEDNGMPGLQRNDDSFPTACPTPDLLIF